MLRGLMNFRVDSVSPVPPSPFPMNLALFCTELAQTVNFNESNANHPARTARCV